MKIRVVIAAGDQGLAQQIQTALLEMDGVEVAQLATTGQELSRAVMENRADIVLVHEDLSPGPVLSLIKELTLRRPATAVLLVAREADTDTVTAAMEAGARGLVALPLSFEQVQARIRALMQKVLT